MRKRSRKQARLPDPNTLAFNIVQAVAGQPLAATPADDPPKNPHAVALGRSGGLKGGVARARKMTKKERSASAKKAAKARWAQKRSQ